jgi:hypothetical protein
MTEFFQHEKYRLGDLKDEYIAQWTRDLLKHPIIGTLNLTARQRRVIATLIWNKKVAEGNRDAPTNEPIQPPPVAGLDARRRVVVQMYDGKGADGKPFLRMWALTKEGEPADIKEPVYSVKTGERVIPPAYARSEER